jgi:hypothetical protein
MSAAAVAPIQCIERDSLMHQLRAVSDELLLREEEEIRWVARGEFELGDSVRDQLRLNTMVSTVLYGVPCCASTPS